MYRRQEILTGVKFLMCNIKHLADAQVRLRMPGSQMPGDQYNSDFSVLGQAIIDHVQLSNNDLFDFFDEQSYYYG